MDDVWKVCFACGIVLRLLDPGRNSSRVKFDTVHKMKMFVSIYTQTSRNVTDVMFMSDYGKSVWISHLPTNILWFKHFIQGCHQYGRFLAARQSSKLIHCWLMSQYVTRGLDELCRRCSLPFENSKNGLHNHYRIFCYFTRRRNWKIRFKSYDQTLG